MYDLVCNESEEKHLSSLTADSCLLWRSPRTLSSQFRSRGGATFSWKTSTELKGTRKIARTYWRSRTWSSLQRIPLREAQTGLRMKGLQADSIHGCLWACSPQLEGFMIVLQAVLLDARCCEAFIHFTLISRRFANGSNRIQRPLSWCGKARQCRTASRSRNCGFQPCRTSKQLLVHCARPGPRCVLEGQMSISLVAGDQRDSGRCHGGLGRLRLAAPVSSPVSTLSFRRQRRRGRIRRRKPRGPGPVRWRSVC